MLTAINIHKSYRSGAKIIEVLRGVSVKFAPGSFSALIGPSGAGKSTLLHILGGLDAPDEGQVNFENEDIYVKSDRQLGALRNARIGFVFQFYHLLPEFTVFENVMMPALIKTQDACLTGRQARRRTQVKEKVRELLSQVGLTERQAHFPGELSGGEQQRAAIARALINEPKLLLCDEPTGNLDSATGNQIMGAIKSLNQQSNMTVVLVTHNNELTKLADSVYHLKDGVLAN